MAKNNFSFLLTLGIFLLTLYACNNKGSETHYELDVIQQIERYKSLVDITPEKELVDLKTEIPELVFDIRYAATNNFTGQKIYDSPRAFARKPVADALKNVQTQLKEKGLGLKIFDAYRPYSATVMLYEAYPDTNYVAAPWNGSRHNRGCAVDVTLVNLANGKQLTMPTSYDDFTEKAAPSYMQLPDSVIANRRILMDVMTENGFSTYPYEWWHFDYEGWENYELMDLSFEELDRHKN
ncbi:MAG: M15 family metallopeptidase [Gracilimonas sp.]|uniref:M15 family metallopeptidase n=1 Tax=Gracilimonas TaxID=649462 RepID=UPI001B2D41C0|nr:M15 family metallopeptidase [Gracilimonas sp.]MBO6585549.1 M15 family metallopeptidase [Gracilimonas sp.]MBO6616546.1 M15 family metallopeptidase [Gracilimonas sp.]